VKRVLLVNDHEEDLHVLKVLLQSHGYSVDLAKDGTDTLVRDLEQKMLELERVKQALEREVGERRKTEAAMRRQSALDELAKDLLCQIVSAPATDLGTVIDSALRRIAAFMGADSVIVFEASEDLDMWGATHWRTAPRIQSMAESLKLVPMGTLPWIESVLREGRTVCLCSADDLPSQAVDMRALWEKQNLSSALMVPLRGRGFSVRGCLSLFGVANRSRWEQRDVYQVEQLAEVIASALSRKHAEESLRASDERLQHAQRMEVIGRLASGITHDFNNLLTAIVSHSDLILEGTSLDTPSPAAEDGVREIRKAAQRAAELSGRILAFSRREAPRPEVVSLNDAITEVRPLLERTLGKDLEVQFELDPELGMCEVDPHQLVSVLMNLAVNARDAMPYGGRLVVETANVAVEADFCKQHTECQPGEYVRLSVSDTGTGMDKETQSHIFEPFFTTKDPGHGTGLGLSTVRGIVKQSAGYILVRSEPDKGSTFEIYLPRSNKTMKREVAVPTAERRSHGGSAILVVEDEDVIRALIKRALEAEGYDVLLAAQGEEALALMAGTDPIHLLLTDLTLPGEIQGAAVIRRARESWPDLPVICMSGYSRDTAPGIDGLDIAYLEKPFTIGEIAAKVRELLRGR
jgi:signal transduction histidine kinase/DNA-binding response OmpR family regulator